MPDSESPNLSREYSSSGKAPLPRLVVALPAEARPLVRHFGLEAIETRAPYAVFRGERAWLVTTGVGKLRAAAGTAYLHARSGSEPGAVWVNAGIAGHADAPFGSVFLAHKVTDQASGRAWYPPLAVTPPVPTATVRTVDAPDEEYGSSDLVDMEAAAFIATASGFSTGELVHVLKTVSDNRESGTGGITSARVEEWIEALVPALDLLIARLELLAREHASTRADPPGYAEILARAHFTATSARRLRELLRRLSALEPQSLPPLVGAWRPGIRAREILVRLEDAVRLASERIAE